MKIIYIETPFVKSYSYYSDIYNSLKNNNKLSKIYNYNKRSKIFNLKDIIEEATFTPDIFIFGFGFFNIHKPPMPKIIKNVDIDIAMILNKEYQYLDEKLQYIKEIKPKFTLTVQHNYKKYQEITNIPFYQLPFAVNPTIFKRYNIPYKYDIAFTGIIRKDQTNDWRTKISKNIHLLKKYSVLFSGRCFKTLETYSKALCTSKIWISTTGPADIVGTRYYEVMATGTTLLLCNRFDEAYEGLFIENKHYVAFNSIKEFVKKIDYYLKNEEERVKIIKEAQTHVLKNHTWKHRGNKIIELIED